MLVAKRSHFVPLPLFQDYIVHSSNEISSRT
uniref:Uncharacterized protein n=1 Tax=Siphoviridae sp. ctMAv2 TaxID=2826258 RepID=A0A8S5LSU4_9CAUD|nr:MAG TPA: hypothetical protein [Siphoviridae sp. ctMAv2]